MPAMIATPSVSQSKSQMVKQRGMTISKNVTRLNHLKAIDFWKQLLGLLQILLLNHQHLMFVARFAKHAELPRRRPRVAAKKASVVRLQNVWRWRIQFNCCSTQPAATPMIVTSTSKVRKLNLNQRRFGLVSVTAVPHATGRVSVAEQFTTSAKKGPPGTSCAGRGQGSSSGQRQLYGSGGGDCNKKHAGVRGSSGQRRRYRGTAGQRTFR